MASLLDDKDTVEQAGYEHSYGNVLEKWYFDNYEDNKYYQRAPEDVAKTAFQEGRRVEPGETYESWASRHKIDKFTTKTAERLPVFEKEREMAVTRQDNEENMSGLTRGAISGTYGVVGSALSIAPLLLGKVAQLPTGGERNAVSDWLANAGGGIFKHFEEKASLYPTLSFFDQNDPGFSVNPEIKANPLRFVAESVGNVIPSVGMMIAGALTGGAGFGAIAANAAGSGMFKKAVNHFAQKAVHKGVFAEMGEEATKYAANMMGRYAGGFSANFAMMGGDNFMAAADALQQKYIAAGVPPEEAYLRAYDDTSATFAVTTTAAASAIDFIGGNWSILNKLLGTKKASAAKELLKIAQDSRANPQVVGKALNALKTLTADTVKNFKDEFLQESAQEFLSLANVDFADPDFSMLSADAVKQLIAAGIAGGVGGGGMAIGGKVAQAGKDMLSKQPKDGDIPAEVVRTTQMIANQEKHLAANPESAADVQPLLDENKARLAELLDYAGAIDPKAGVSYADAVKVINEQAPNPTGKNFTAKALRKLIADPENPLTHVKGASGQEYRGTVDKASLDAFVQMRNPSAQPVAQPATTPSVATQTPTVPMPSAVPAAAPVAPEAPAVAPLKPGQTAKMTVSKPASQIPELDAAFPADGIAFDEVNHRYSRPDGKPFEGVTAGIAAGSGTDTEQIIERMTINIADPKARAAEADKLRKEFDEKREGGTATHAKFEKIIAGDTADADPQHVAVVDELTQGGALSAAGERVIYSDELNLAGTADITVKQADGSFKIYDLKTVDELPADGEDVQEMGYYAGGVDSKYNKHGVQLTAYKQILESKKLSVSGMGVVLVARDGSGHKIVDVQPSDNLKAGFERAYPGRTLDTSPAASAKAMPDEEFVGAAAVDMSVARSKGHNAPGREQKAKALADVARAVATKEGFKADKDSKPITLGDLKKYDGAPMRDIKKAFEDLVEEEIIAAFHAHGLKVGPPNGVKARTAQKPSKSLTARNVLAIIKDKLPILLKHVVVYDSIAQVEDPELRAWLYSEEGVQGFFHEGKIYINAALVKDSKDLAIVIAHELIHAAEKPFISKLINEFGVMAGVEEWNNILDRAWNDFNGEIVELHKTGYEKLYDITTVEGQRDMAREFLSERGAHGKSATWLNRLVAAFRKIVNRVLAHFGKSELALSESEVRVLISEMKSAVAADLNAGRGLDSIDSSPRAKKEEVAKPVAPAFDEGKVKARADLSGRPAVDSSPGVNPELKRVKVRQANAEDIGTAPEKSEAELAEEIRQLEQAEREGAMTKEEIHALRVSERDAREAVEVRRGEIKKRQDDALQAEKAAKRAERLEDDKLIVERIVMKEVANFRRVGEDWEARLEAEKERVREHILELRASGVKFDENMLDRELREKAVQVAANLKKAREGALKEMNKREQREEKTRAAVEAKAERVVDVMLPDPEVVLDPVLRAPGRKLVQGLDVSELRKSIAKHSKIRFAWADYIKEAIKAEDYNIILSGVLEAFAHASAEAAILSTYPVDKTVVVPTVYETADRAAILTSEEKRASQERPMEKDLLNSAIKEMKEIGALLDALVSKYEAGTHAAQYGDLFSSAVRKFNSSLYSLYKMKKGATSEETLARLYKQIADDNRDKITGQRVKGENAPSGRDVSLTKLSWFNFPSLVEYFDHVLLRHRIELDDPKDTLRSGLPGEVKDLIAWSRAVQTSVAFFRGRLKDSHAQALIEAAELQMVEPVDNFASAAVTEDEAETIGTAFKTVRQAGESESDLSAEDKAGLEGVRFAFKLANDIRSAITRIGHVGTIFSKGTDGSGDAKNTIGVNLSLMLDAVYETAVDGLLGIKSTADNIFNYKTGKENLLANYEEVPVENSGSDNVRLIEAAERLGLPAPSVIVPMFPKIDGVSALDFYLEKFHEAKAEDSDLAALSDDEFIVALVGIGYYNTKMRIFDPKFMSEGLVERLLGVGAIITDLNGNVAPMTKYGVDSPIGKVIRKPLGEVITLPDNPRMGTFVRGALMPKKALAPEESSYENDDTLFADPTDDKLLLAQGKDLGPKYGIVRSFRPGSILYHQTKGSYSVVGPEVREENGKLKYEIIEVTSESMVVGGVQKHFVRTGERQWLTHAQLSNRPIAVVPRVWDIMSGHGERGKGGQKGNLAAMDDYKIYTTIRVNDAKAKLYEIAQRTGLPVSGASFGHISRDVNGNRVLSVAAPGGAIHYFRVGQTDADASSATDTQAFEMILAEVISAARAEGMHLYRRQAGDAVTDKDVLYLEDTISEAVALGQKIVGKLVMQKKISFSQGVMARRHIRQISTIAALNIEDDRIDTVMLAEKIEEVMAERLGSYDEKDEGFGRTAPVLLSALKKLKSKNVSFLRDLFGDLDSLDSEGAHSSEDIMHMLDQSSETSEDGDESFSSNANVRLVGDLPREFVDAQVQDYIQAILEGDDFDVATQDSEGLARMQADIEARKKQLREANLAVSVLGNRPDTSGSLMKMAKDRSKKLSEQLKKDLATVQRRVESETAAAERHRLEVLAAVKNAEEIFKNIATRLNSEKEFLYQTIKNERGGSRLVARHAFRHFSDRIMAFMNMTMDYMSNKITTGIDDMTPMDNAFFLSFYSNLIVGLLMDGSRNIDAKGFSAPQLRLALASILRQMPIEQADGSFRAFKDLSGKQRKAVIGILGKASFLQAVIKRQIQLSDLPLNHVFTSLIRKTENVPYISGTGAQQIAKGVPGATELLTGISDPNSVSQYLEEKDPLALPSVYKVVNEDGVEVARGVDFEAFALRVANGTIHPLFGHLATGDSLFQAMENVRAMEEAAFRVPDKKTSRPSAKYYGDRHVMPDHFGNLLEEEIAERFMAAVDQAEGETSPYFPYKKAVARARDRIMKSQEGLTSKAPGLSSEKQREKIKHGNLGDVQNTVSSMRALETEIAKIGDSAGLMHQILLDIPGVKQDATGVEDVDSFISQDATKYIKMLYHEMFPEESYLGISDVTPSSADMKVVDAINYIIPGFIKMRDGGISGNPNFRETTKFDGESVVVIPDSFHTDFGWRMVGILMQLLNAVREMPRAFTADMRNRALQVTMSNISAVYGDAAAKKVLATMQKKLGFGAGDAPRFRINQTGKVNRLAVNEEQAINDTKAAAEKWLDELNTVKSDGRPGVIVHGVGQTAEKQLKWMSAEEKDSLSKIYRDALFALKNAFGFRDKNGDIHIFLDQHVGADGTVDMAEVMRTVYHEYVAHVGLRRTLGAEYDAVMEMVFEKYCNPSGNRSSLTTAQKVHIAEEYFGEKAEDIKWDPALGRANNRHIGNALDRIASIIVKKFRAFAKKMFNLDIKMTGVEVRDIMRQAFEGTSMSGRTGFSSFLAPGMVPGENLTSYAGFSKYAMNMIDRIQWGMAAKLLPFERLERAYLSNPNAVPIDGLHLDQDKTSGFYGEELPFGRKVLFNFMSHFSAFKSRAAERIDLAIEREAAYAKSYAGKSYKAGDVSATGTAIYTLQRMIYETQSVYRARWEAELQARAAAAGKPELTADLLNKLWSRRLKKLFEDRKISGMTLRDAINALGDALRSGHLSSISERDAQLLIGRTMEIDGVETFFPGIVGNFKPGLLVELKKGDAEDIALSRKTIESLYLIADKVAPAYEGPMVSTLKYIWDASEEMASASASAGLISEQDLAEMTMWMPQSLVAPGGGSRAFRGIGGMSVIGGNRFSYEEDGTRATTQEWPDAPSATFSALRRRHVEAEINKAVTTLFNFVAYNPLKDVFNLVVQEDIITEFKSAHKLFRDDSTTSVTPQTRGKIITHMSQNGISLMSDPDMAKKVPSTLAQKKNMEARDGLIPVYINGRLNYIKILHPELANSFQLHFRPNRAGDFVRGLSMVNRWLISMATLLSPEFWLSNTPRDISMAIGVLAMQGNIGGKDGLVYAKSAAKMIPSAMRYIFLKNFGKDTSGVKHADIFDKYYDDFKSGGEIQWAFMETSIETMKSLESKIRLARGEANKADHFVNAKNSFVGFMKNISGAFENTTRFVVFTAAREAGLANDKAVMMARNVTVDFDKKGAYGELFNTLYMFANAGIQANLNIAKLIRNNPGRAAKAIGGMIAISFGLAMMNFVLGGDGDDDEPYYGAVPQEVRNSHIMVMLPFTDGMPLKVPFPYGFSFFWGIGQELASMVFGRSSAGQATAGILDSLMKNFNPMETAAGLRDSHGWARMISPTITDPFVDILAEKTPFGTPLMPEATFEGQPDAHRHWRSVTSINKSLARTMNEWTGGSAGESGLVDISPETLDYMYDTITGGLGKFLARVGGIIVSPATGKEIGVNDIPGIRRFVGGQQKWEARGRFSSNYDQVLGAHATYRELRDSANMAQVGPAKVRAQQDLEDFRKQNSHILGMRTVANNTLSRVKKIDKEKERLYKSGLSDREIQPRLRVLDERQQSVFSDFNRVYYQTVDLN